MKISAIRLLYFSPTGTTKVVLENIAAGLCAEMVNHVDVTLPDADRHAFLEMKDDELLVVGAPVYAGRIPEIAAQRFQKMRSRGNPAVLVVVYGNREFEDALLELSDLAQASGFVPVAGGAFIGEHSFSTKSTPLAEGRPDASDIRKAREFGVSIGQLLQNIQNIGEIRPPKLPGNRPFRGPSILPKVSPVVDKDRCTACGNCAAVCPTGSICIKETSCTRAETCVLCCACIKTCPARARALKDPTIAQIIGWLQAIAANRKEPEVFPGSRNQ
jgi:ferredoxin/flavodoxin